MRRPAVLVDRDGTLASVDGPGQGWQRRVGRLQQQDQVRLHRPSDRGTMECHPTRD